MELESILISQNPLKHTNLIFQFKQLLFLAECIFYDNKLNTGHTFNVQRKNLGFEYFRVTFRDFFFEIYHEKKSKKLCLTNTLLLFYVTKEFLCKLSRYAKHSKKIRKLIENLYIYSHIVNLSNTILGNRTLPMPWWVVII